MTGHLSNTWDSRVMKDLQGFFKPGQREAIYNSCETPRDKLIVRLLWKTGRRISEVLELQRGDIDIENCNIIWNIKKKKVKEFRRIKPVDKKTMQLLVNYMSDEGLLNVHFSEYIFASPFTASKPLSRQRVFQVIRKAAKKAGIYTVGEKQVHPHHFRHSFAVEMAKKLKNPTDLKKLQTYLEHANITMTEQYLQFGDLEMRNLIEEEVD